MKRVNNFFSVSLLAALMFSSCQDKDVLDSADHVQPSGEQVKLHLGLNIQSNFQSGLRAISAADEESIEHIDVLVFVEEDNDGVFYYSYRKTANLPDTTVVVETNYNHKQQLVVITNAEEAVKELFKADQVNQPKDYVLGQLTFSLDGETKWNTTDTNDYTKFPMWGESEPASITKDSGEIPIALQRMVARIDVTNNAGDFKIDSLYLYNTNTWGFIVPSKMPPLTSAVPPIGYAAKDSIRSIYTFETVAPPAGDATLATCLVIAGYYNNEVQTSYYRVDFLKEDANGKKTLFADIERNHRYTVNIIGVKARGYDTKEEAFSAKSLNIETGVDDWEEASDDVVANGQYFLKVSAEVPLKFEADGTLKFSKESSTGNKFTVETDLLTGWTASVSGGGGVTLGNTSGTYPNSQLSFNVEAYKQGGTTDHADIRTNTITVQAGRLKREIIIRQANVGPVTIKLSSSVGTSDSDGNIIISVDASSGGILASSNNTLKVEWTPKTHYFHLWQAPAGLSFANLINPDLFFSRPPSNSTDFDLTINQTYGSGYLNDTGVKITGQATNGFQTIEKSIVLKISRP